MNAVLDELKKELKKVSRIPTKSHVAEEISAERRAQLHRAVSKGVEFFNVISRRLRLSRAWFRGIIEAGQNLQLGTSSQFDVVFAALGRNVVSLALDTNIPPNYGESEGSGDLIDLIVLPDFEHDYGFAVPVSPNLSVEREFLKEEWLRRAQRLVLR